MMKTLALVIGNNNYFKGYELGNAVNDASSIADVFNRLNFEVIFKDNCTSDDVPDLLTEFEIKISDYDASIFYFAGHGFEFEGENYLANIDCSISQTNTKAYYNRSCIRLNEVLDIFKKKPNNVNIAIIDACRKSIERGANIGVSSVQAPKGTLLAFSTSPNEGAKDKGIEGHSVFTGALLQYIGRENLSVETLFKKVRQTVYNLTNGTQTTWEHSSLIGDYYFNIGQLAYSTLIRYSDDVVKDKEYFDGGRFGELITMLKSHNWYMQNPSVDEILNIPPTNLNNNQKFVLGRNLLQAADGGAFHANGFISDISSNIIKYDENGENHVLNGILFEMYFNSSGEFRKHETKKKCFDEIIPLRKDNRFQKSFKFIQEILRSTRYDLIYIPEEIDYHLDIDVIAIQNGDVQIIEKITFKMNNITKQIPRRSLYHTNDKHLCRVIADFFTAPIDLVHIHSNIDLHKIEFHKTNEIDADLPF